MASSGITIWGIRAGRNGEADPLFRQQNRIGIGWPKLGDLTKYGTDREALKKAVREAYPGKKPGAIPNNAGQLFRFVHEMALKDLVAYPCKGERTICVGQVTGDYDYRPDLDATFPNQRTVEWLKPISRTHLTQGALYELGSSLSLFQVKNCADELLNALEGLPPVSSPFDDETVAPVSAEIEQTTKDFILKKLVTELKGHPFAALVGHLLECMGYHTRIAAEGRDGGVDIIAHKDELGFEPPLVKVQVKSGEGSIGDPAVSALCGKVGPTEFGLLVTLGTFTTAAKHFGRSKSNLRLVDGDELIDLLLRYYEQLDARYKAFIPLKRVYVPELAEEDGA